MRLDIPVGIAPVISGFRMTKTTYQITISNRDNAIYEVGSKEPILDSLRNQGVDLPYGCKYGGCITCAAKLIDGNVTQKTQVALNNRQLNDGYVILCVARATSDCTFEIGVESHDKLYRNPFLDPLKPHELKADIATPLIETPKDITL
ncbi:MAG: ferredoxin [Gammaproteobacteria bacterium]|jgi:ferredoxin